MKVIIAGGRDYRLTADDLRWLDGLGLTYVVTGAMRGVDRDAENWARHNEITYLGVPAKWTTTQPRKSAGPRRNRKMAEHLARVRGDDKAVILFPGDSGTASMRREAERAGLRVIEAHDRQLALDTPRPSGHS